MIQCSAAQPCQRFLHSAWDKVLGWYLAGIHRCTAGALMVSVRPGHPLPTPPEGWGSQRHGLHRGSLGVHTDTRTHTQFEKWLHEEPQNTNIVMEIPKDHVKSVISLWSHANFIIRILKSCFQLNKKILIQYNWQTLKCWVFLTPVGHSMIRGENVGGSAVVMVEVLYDRDQLFYTWVHQSYVLLVLPGLSDTATQNNTKIHWFRKRLVQYQICEENKIKLGDICLLIPVWQSRLLIYLYS